MAAESFSAAPQKQKRYASHIPCQCVLTDHTRFRVVEGRDVRATFTSSRTRMCNAAKHSPGCQCGFGPPYTAGYSIGDVREWAEEALDDATVARRGLVEMAWDETAIELFLQRYLEIRNSDLPRDSMVSRIRELLGLRRKVVEDVSEDWISVPLYRFGAPPVEGASVELAEGESMTGGAGWSVKVLGIGSGDSTTLQVSKAKTYVAKANTCKVVLVPVKLRVARIAVFDHDRLVGRGYDAHAVPLSEDGDPHLYRRECRSLPAARCSTGPSEALEVLDLSLANDLSDAVHRDKRVWEMDVAHEVSAQLKKIADISALVRVKRTRRFELSFALPSGHDYLAYMCAGVTWWLRPGSRS